MVEGRQLRSDSAPVTEKLAHEQSRSRPQQHRSPRTQAPTQYIAPEQEIAGSCTAGLMRVERSKGYKEARTLDYYWLFDFEKKSPRNIRDDEQLFGGGSFAMLHLRLPQLRKNDERGSQLAQPISCTSTPALYMHPRREKANRCQENREHRVFPLTRRQ